MARKGPWVKFYVNFLDNQRIRLAKLEEQAVLAKWYLLAERTAGVIQMSLVAQQDRLAVPRKTLTAAFRTFSVDGGPDDPPMLSGRVENFTIAAYAEHQRKPSETPAAWAERQRNRRAKVRLQKGVVTIGLTTGQAKATITKLDTAR